MKIKWEETASRGKNHAVLVMDEVCDAFEEHITEKYIPEVRVKNFRQFAGCRWFSEEDRIDYIAALKKFEAKKLGNLLNYAKIYTKLLDDKRKWIDKISQLDLASKTNVELYQIYKENNDQNKEYLSNSYNYIMLNKFYPDLLIAKIAEKVKDFSRQTEITKVLFALDRPSEMRLEKESILQIASLLQTENYKIDDEKIQEMISSHLKKFAHLGMYYFWRKPYDKSDIEERLSVLVDKDLPYDFKDLEEQKLIPQRTKEIIKDLNLDSETQIMIETIKAFAYAANYFDETYNYMTYHLSNLWTELEKRFGLAYNQLVSMRGREILKMLKDGEVSPELKTELSDRFLDHAMILENGQTRVISGEELKEYYKKQKQEAEDYSSVKELMGQSASPGKAEGKVCLIMTIDDVSKVKKGEILVASATTPSYVPAMEKASAIVTNEGGLLSHAAIVSRELGVPCVVGTKIATKALKNGEMVEVDASNGIVRRI